MYRYDSTPIDINTYEKENGELPRQVSQISMKWDKDRVIEVCYEEETGKVVINDNDKWYYFTSPDFPKMRLIDVIYGLGYRDETIIVDWNEDKISSKDVLTSLVTEAPLNQITLFTSDKYESVLIVEISLIILLMTITLFCMLWL